MGKESVVGGSGKSQAPKVGPKVGAGSRDEACDEGPGVASKRGGDERGLDDSRYPKLDSNDSCIARHSVS